MTEEKTDGLSLLSWINVVLSFLFMAIGVPLLLSLVILLVWGFNWRFLILESPYCWGVLAIGAVLGFGNATRYYKQLKAKLLK